MRITRPVVLTLAALALAPAGCVIVSTSRSERDAGPADAGPIVDSGPRPDTGGAVLGADATRAMLASVGERVILDSYRDFDAAAAELERTTTAHAASGSTEDLEAARAAWRAAIAIWQQAELMQLGPAGMGGTDATPGVLGGRDLRDQIYAYPLINRCRIDQETVSLGFEEPDALATEAVNVRGLGAIEYLLFFEPASNGCSSSAAINSSGSWAALSADEIRARRARYARSAAILVRRAAATLRSAWEPTGEDWVGQLGRAGAGASVYPSAQEALNGLSDALFYLYDVVKDMKVAGPAALSDACASTSCPDLLESRYAHVSREHLIANLRGFQRLFLGDADGTDAPGFDDLLAAVGAGELAARMTAAIADAITAAEALPALDASSLEGALEAMATLHTRIRAIGDLLKTEVVTVLDLELPDRAQGDND